jgi:hypothetical protein
MKRYTFIFALCFLAVALQAQEDLGSYSRSITKYGGALTVGDTFVYDNLGYGLTTMTYQYIDPTTPWGFYYGFGGTDISHSAGGVLIGDCRLATIGWRKEVAGPLGFDMSFSPVLGSRTIGSTILGKYYLGAKPMVGTFFVINEKIDIELAYEPVLNIYSFSSSEVRNKTYHDFSLYLMFKNFSLIKNLGWNAIRGPKTDREGSTGVNP